MTDQHRQALLSSSADYSKARLAFANDIVVARRAGLDDQEIAHGIAIPVWSP